MGRQRGQGQDGTTVGIYMRRKGANDAEQDVQDAVV
jgi:hypothetical protein